MRVLGQGIQRGYINRNNEFNIYTREAGAGNLSIAIEGPSKAEIDFEASYYWKANYWLILQ